MLRSFKEEVVNVSEPEGLYPTYRIAFTRKLIPLLNQGISFKIEGLPGVGKSKYLRHLCTSEHLQTKYFAKPSIKFFYLDLNIVFTGDTKQLANLISEKLELKKPSVKAVEEKIGELLKKYDLVYFVIDHAEQLLEFDQSAIRYIRAVRDIYKYKMGVILAYESGTNFNSDKMKHLNDITSLEFVLEPFTHDEAIENLKHFAKVQNVTLSENDLELLAKATKGYAKHIRQLLNEMMVGKSAQEAIEITRPSNIVYDSGGIDALLDKAMKTLTKSEFLVFKELYLGRGKVVTRDQLASILNPETEGLGVSNESIDQIVSRVRKALAEAHIDIDIKTKRGIGYFV